MIPSGARNKPASPEMPIVPFLQAKLVDALDGVLPPAIPPVAHILDPLLRLFPPSGAVENIRRHVSFTREDGEDFRGEAADRSQIA